MTSAPVSKRLIGIDYGSQRIGVAISDPLGIIAHPRATWENNSLFWTNMADLIRSEGATMIVVGMPLNLKGQKGMKADEVDVFIERIKKEFGLEVVAWDERFTTAIARQTLLTMGTKKKDRRTGKHNIDAMAASVILQSFLDSTKKSLVC